MSRKWLGPTFAVLIVVVGAAAAWWLLLRSTPEKAVAAYVAAVKANDGDGAKALLSVESVRLIGEIRALAKQATPSLDPFQELAMRMIPPVTHVQTETRVCPSRPYGAAGDVAIVPLEYEIRGDPSSTAFLNDDPRPRVVCVKERGEWRLDFTRELRAFRNVLPKGLGIERADESPPA